MDANGLNPFRLWMDFCELCDRVLRIFCGLREGDRDVAKENKKNCLQCQLDLSDSCEPGLENNIIHFNEKD